MHGETVKFLITVVWPW